jgi:glycine betaine/proline transport system substrate-binding protein
MKNKTIPIIVAIVVVIAGLVFFMGGDKTAKKSGDSSQPIVIAEHNWSSQIVMAHVIGGIFESMGNNVKYVPADSQAVYESINIGDVTIAHEVWESAFGKSFDNARDKGGVLDWGDHEARTIEDMGYPDWAVKYCPGLPDWNALKNPDCAKAFSTPDSGGKGRMLEGPQSWHGDLIPQRIEALGLGDLWTVKFAGGADALWAELKAAKNEGRGTIIFNWTPNFTDGSGFTFIDFPPYYDGCRPVDGGDGKCGAPDGYLKKAVNVNFPKTHPDAAAMYKKLSFNTSQIGAMAALVDEDKMTHADAAKKWLADNKNVWEKWTK